jgi:hypothetical protein
VRNINEEVDINKAKEWAIENVEATRHHLDGCWKVTTKQ